MIQIGLASLLALLILGASRVLGFWTFLVLMGGILAHFGDHLGTMVGKKRLSLFGVRPKYTAILVNFTTGALITMATLLGAVLISAEYRDALTNLEQKKQEREAVTKNIVQLQNDSRELATKLQSSLGRLRELEVELRKADDTRQVLAKEIENRTAQKEKAERLANLYRATKETGTVAINKGHALVRHPLLVPMNVTKAQLKVNLLAMMAEIRDTVTAEGVEVPPAKPERFDTDLVEPILAQIATIKKVTESSLSAEFGGHTPKNIYIRPVANKNVAKGETLTGMYFDVQPNTVSVVSGEEIAHTPVNGKLDPQQLLQQLINFDHAVTRELRRRGVLAESLDERVNQVSADILTQFLRIIELVRKQNRWVEVRLVSSADILCYGPISATYQVVEPTTDEDPDADASPAPASAPSAAASPRTSATASPGP